jgi:hypothetical protein
MKKVVPFLMMLCVLNVLLAGGLFAFLFGTGRLDSEKGRAIVDMLKHQGTPAKLREQVYDIMEPSTAPGTATKGAATLPGSAADEGSLKSGASAEERIAFARQAMEQERLALENEAQDLRHRQELLVQLQADVQAKLQKIEAARKEAEPRAATAETKLREENFQKTMALYDELKTKQVKEIFFASGKEELTAAYLTAMDASRAGKIIAEFKTDDERAFIQRVLERIRTNGTSSASGTKAAADMTAAAPGATAPASVP